MLWLAATLVVTRGLLLPATASIFVLLAAGSFVCVCGGGVIALQSTAVRCPRPLPRCAHGCFATPIPLPLPPSHTSLLNFPEERFLREDLASYMGDWPERVFVGMGGKEYTGIRPKKNEAWADGGKPEGSQWDELLQGYALALSRLLAVQVRGWPVREVGDSDEGL